MSFWSHPNFPEDSRVNGLLYTVGVGELVRAFREQWALGSLISSTLSSLDSFFGV